MTYTYVILICLQVVSVELPCELLNSCCHS